MEEELRRLRELKAKLSPIQKKLDSVKKDLDKLLVDNSDAEYDLENLVEILELYKKHYPNLHIVLETPKVCADDILEALGWEIKVEQKSLFSLPDLSEDEKVIYDTLEIEEKSVDELQAFTKLSIDNLLMYLTTMELKGIIKQVDGDRYKRVNPVNRS